MGDLPAAAPVAAFAVTVTVLVEPAWMTTLAAWDCEPTWVVMVQPSGPGEATGKLSSSGLSFLSVSVKLNDASDAPLSSGVSVVSEIDPATLGSTRTATGGGGGG